MPGSATIAAVSWNAHLPLGLLLVAAALATPAPASAEEDFFEPIGLGMGGAVRVLGTDTSAIRLNPSAMTARPRYLAGSSYTFYGREKSHTIATGAFDSRSSPFALGTEYTAWIFEPPFVPETDLRWFPASGLEEIHDKRTWHRWDIAAAYGFAQRRVNVGLSARVVQQTFEIRAKRTFFTMDGGVTVWPLQFLAIGASVQNFIPARDPRFPIRLSPGVALDLNDVLQAEVDMVFDFTSQEQTQTDLHAGVKVTLLQAIGIRGGYYSDRQFIDNYITWGLGLRIEQARLTIDYGMRIEAGPMEKRLRPDRPEGAQRILNTVGFEFDL